LNELKNWIIKNFWNLFSVLGVAGTFYFSLQVPDYIKDISKAKINIIHESLIDDIQEILFYEKELSIEDINSFIKGKELKRSISYSYTADELLIQVQERFISNKFISLEKRETLINRIKEIRKTYIPAKIPSDTSFNWLILISWILSAIGILIALLGIASIMKKIRTDKETEVDIVSGDITIHNHHNSRMSSFIEYERMVGEILKELNVIKPLENRGRDIGYDFEANDKNNNYIIEVKRYKKLLGLGTAREFLYQVNKSKQNGILITFSGVTQRTKELIYEHNKISENQKVYLVMGESKSIIKKQLSEIFIVDTSNKTEERNE